MTPKPRRPPGNLSHLQRLANAAANEQSIPVKRYQRWINVQVLSAVLERVRDEDDEPLFALKGGAAMELRLGLTARASADYDATFRAHAGEMLDRLDEALRRDWNGFTLQRTEAIPIAATRTRRMDVKLAYKGRSWGTIQLEVGPSEGRSGREIDRVPARPLDAVLPPRCPTRHDRQRPRIDLHVHPQLVKHAIRDAGPAMVADSLDAILRQHTDDRRPQRQR